MATSASYGPRPQVVPDSISPGYGVAISDPRVSGFYDGSTAQAEWGPTVEDQWNTALQTEFADMEVRNTGTSDDPPAPAPVPSTVSQSILAPTEKHITRDDRFVYDTLLSMALKLNTITDKDKAAAAENKFLKKSSDYLAVYPDEVTIWMLRARLAVQVNQEDLGREAGMNLKRLVDAGCDDTKWHGLMVELNAREWLSAKS